MIIHDTTEIEHRGEDLHEIWWQGRQWAVTAYGIECRDGSYPIEAKRLTEEHKQKQPYSWIAHIRDKKCWADIDDFATAYFVACAVPSRASPALNAKCSPNITPRQRRENPKRR
jgi:hypothetical protein